MGEHPYPHCKHCAWGNEHHPDDEPGHATPCISCPTGVVA